MASDTNHVDRVIIVYKYSLYIVYVSKQVFYLQTIQLFHKVLNNVKRYRLESETSI